MAGAAANRIRRANFLDLVADTLDACRTRLDEALPKVRETQTAIDEQRGLLARQLAETMQTELLANRRQWENRLLGQAASRWGLSPFALVLRVYQGLGCAGGRGAAVSRPHARPGGPVGRAARRAHVEVAAAEASGRPRARSRGRRRLGPGRAAQGRHHRRWLRGRGRIGSPGESRQESTLPPNRKRPRRALSPACRPTSIRWWPGSPSAIPAGSPAGATKSCLLAMLGLLLYRLGKNFFYDSWLADAPDAGPRIRLLRLGRFLAGAVVPAVALGVLQPVAARAARRDHPVSRRLARRLIGRRPVRPRRVRLPPRRSLSARPRCPAAGRGRTSAAIGEERNVKRGVPSPLPYFSFPSFARLAISWSRSASAAAPGRGAWRPDCRRARPWRSGRARFAARPAPSSGCLAA